MSASLLNRRSGVSSSGRRSSYSPMAEINVTPMVDVMLVLLIVFMVAAPLLTVGVPVDLPKSQANALNDDKPPLVITVNSNNQLFIGDSPIEESNLVAKLQAITNANPEAVIYVRGDQTIQYGKVMEVMGLISSAGYSKVSLVAETPQSSANH
jgi:biopolymer transport protein TolR